MAYEVNYIQMQITNETVESTVFNRSGWVLVIVEWTGGLSSAIKANAVKLGRLAYIHIFFDISCRVHHKSR